MARPSSSASSSKTKHRHTQTKIHHHFAATSSPNKLKSATPREECRYDTSSPDPELAWKLGPPVKRSSAPDADDSETSSSTEPERRRPTPKGRTSRSPPARKRTKHTDPNAPSSSSRSNGPVIVIDDSTDSDHSRPARMKAAAANGSSAKSNADARKLSGATSSSATLDRPPLKNKKNKFVSPDPEEDDVSYDTDTSVIVLVPSKRSAATSKPKKDSASTTTAAAISSSIQPDRPPISSHKYSSKRSDDHPKFKQATAQIEDQLSDDDDLPEVDAAISRSLAQSSKPKTKKTEQSTKTNRVAVRNDDSDARSEEAAPRRPPPKPRRTRDSDNDSSDARAAQRRKDKGKGRALDPPAKKKGDRHSEKTAALPPKKSTSQRKQRAESSEDESSDDAARRRTKTKQITKKRGRRVSSESESGTSDGGGTSSEGATEEEDLLDDAGQAFEYANPQSRLRAKGGKPSARQTHMEKLKASRARKEARKKRAESYDSLFDGSDDALKEPEEEPEPVVHKSAYILNSDGSTSSSDATGVDSDEEDGESVQLPGMFQHVQPIERQFAIVVQFHTHLVIDGAPWYRKNGDQAYFVNALARVRDLMRSTRDLRVSSSTWRPYFNPALERYPTWTQDGIYLERDEVYPRCDACGAQKKPGKIKVDLKGDEYDRDTFKKLVKPSVSVSSDDSDFDDGNSYKPPDGPNDRIFNCGIFCSARARVYHEMTHWEYKLHARVRRLVKALPEEARGGKPANNDTNAVVAYLDKTKVPDSEYKTFEQTKNRDFMVHTKGHDDED